VRAIVVLNRNASLVSQLNACGHICLGLGNKLETANLMLRSFNDADGNNVAILTDHPLIVLSARSSSHIRDAHVLARRAGIPANAFFSCMTTGEPANQEVSVAETPPDNLEYVALALYGDGASLKPITKRFSLYRHGDSKLSPDDAPLETAG